MVVNYFHHKEEADEVVENLLKHGSPAAVAMQADVSHADQAARLIEDTIKQFDRIDVLVNNEGINVDRALKAMSVEDWDRVIQTDLNSYFYTLKAALPYFHAAEERHDPQHQFPHRPDGELWASQLRRCESWHYRVYQNSGPGTGSLQRDSQRSESWCHRYPPHVEPGFTGDQGRHSEENPSRPVRHPSRGSPCSPFPDCGCTVLHRHNHPNQWWNVHALVVTLIGGDVVG